MTDWTEASHAKLIEMHRLLREEIARLRAEIRNWKWVPETLAGQKFDSENVAHAYLRDEFKGLRAKLAEVTRERDEYKQASEKHAQIYSESASILGQKLAASEAREIGLRGAIATLYEGIKHGDETHRAWLKEFIEDHFKEALAAQDPPPLLGALREVADALVEIDDNGNGTSLNAKLAQRALAKLRAAIGGGG